MLKHSTGTAEIVHFSSNNNIYVQYLQLLMVATSTGSRHGMNNLYQGACSRRNMKLTIKVCCDYSTSK